MNLRFVVYCRTVGYKRYCAYGALQKWGEVDTANDNKELASDLHICSISNNLFSPVINLRF